MAGKKQSLPFDSRGGVVTIQRRLLTSQAYRDLTPYAKALLHLMQVHWRHNEPVAFGIREACRLIPCGRKAAVRAFKELDDAGLIRMVDHSLFCSRTQSKARTWRLTWLPWHGSAPTNEWEKRDAA